MSYDPYAMDQNQRENAYWTIWVLAAASAVMLTSNFIEISSIITGLCAALIGAWFITFAVNKRFDDYFMALAKDGAIWAVATLGGWLSLQGLFAVYNAAYGVGLSATGAAASSASSALNFTGKLDSALLLASVCACAFCAGFLKSHLSGKS